MSIQQNLINGSSDSEPTNGSESTNDYEFRSSYFSKSSYRKRLNRLICNGQIFEAIFPPLKWLPKYKWRNDLAYDLMAGFTTGVMLVPQGIAYAFLAGVDPINGLYSSFMSPFLYFLTGLSPHVSRGPSSVLGVMSQISNQAINAEAISHGVKVDLNPSIIASTLTFTCGLIQILMGLLQFRFLSDYFSDALISGFVCAAGTHTLISQLNKFVGVKTKTHSGYFSAFLNVHELAMAYEDFKWKTITLSLGSIVFLVLCKSVTPWICRKYHIVLPCELFLIVTATSLSYLFDWSSSMTIVGEIPSGFPSPQLPAFELIPYCFPHALAICCVTVALHFSMTKLFANKFHYSISLSHELYAIGFGSMFSGLFPTYPTSTALARTVVLVESGARTQLASGFSALLVLVVILFVGPLFESLPQCVLSAIIVVSLKTVFLNFKSVVSLWHTDKFDCAIWCLAFVGTLLTNVITGLGIGVLTALFTLIVRIQWPSWSYKHSTDRDTCVFKFNSSLLFANCERFTEALNKTLNRWLAFRLQESSILPQTDDSNDKATSRPLFVFDCTAIIQLDSMGLQTLLQSIKIIEEEHNVCIQFFNVNSHVLKKLKFSGLDTKIADN